MPSVVQSAEGGGAVHTVAVSGSDQTTTRVSGVAVDARVISIAPFGGNPSPQPSACSHTMRPLATTRCRVASR